MLIKLTTVSPLRENRKGRNFVMLKNCEKNCRICSIDGEQLNSPRMQPTDIQQLVQQSLGSALGVSGRSRYKLKDHWSMPGKLSNLKGCQMLLSSDVVGRPTRV